MEIFGGKKITVSYLVVRSDFSCVWLWQCTLDCLKKKTVCVSVVVFQCQAISAFSANIHTVVSREKSSGAAGSWVFTHLICHYRFSVTTRICSVFFCQKTQQFWSLWSTCRFIIRNPTVFQDEGGSGSPDKWLGPHGGRVGSALPYREKITSLGETSS